MSLPDKLPAADAQMIFILAEARKNIVSGEDPYVCFALNSVSETHIDVNHQCGRLTHWVRELLGGYAYLEDWVIVHHAAGYDPVSLRPYKPTPQEMRELRIQWIDGMVRFIKTNSWDL